MSANNTLKTVMAFDSLSYNGFIFPAFKKKQIKETPIYDESDRYVKYTTISLTVECVVVPEDIAYQADKSDSDVTADLTTYMDIVRSKLNKPGRELIFKDTGYGNIIINVTEENKATYDVAGNNLFLDLDYGPKPRDLQITPLARNKAFKLEWEVETTIPGCANDFLRDADIVSPGSRDNPVAFEFQVRHTFSDEGVISRITEGSIEVPVHGIDDPGLKQDDWWRAIVESRIGWLKGIRGMKRSQEWEWNNKHTILTFRITDTEIPSDNPLFPGTLDMDFAHESRSKLMSTNPLSGGNGFTHWKNRLTGSVVLAPEAPKIVAYWAFDDILERRVAGIPLSRTFLRKRDSSVVQHASWWVPLEFSIKEHIHKRRVDFDMTWLTVMSLSKLLEGQNFFKPATGSTWDLHATNIYVSRTHNKHRRAVIFFNEDEEDYCDEKQYQSYIPKDSPVYAESSYDTTIPKKSTQKPNFLTYKNKLKVKEKTGTLTHVKSKDLPATHNQDPDPNEQELDPDDGKTDALKDLDKEKMLMQIRSSSVFEVSMEGFALRLGLYAKPPVLVELGGAKAIRKDGEWDTAVVSSSDEYPIYLTMWRQTYILEETPDYSNHAEGVNSNGDPGSYS